MGVAPGMQHGVAPGMQHGGTFAPLAQGMQMGVSSSGQIPMWESQESVSMPQGANPLANVQLTMQDWEAVMRLTELGFDKEQCLQAYLRANRNENDAANILLGL